MNYIVPIKSPSGDSYILGPFSSTPTHEQVVARFKTFSDEEAEYLEECGYSYTYYPLGLSEGVLCMQSGPGEICPKEQS